MSLGATGATLLVGSGGLAVSGGVTLNAGTLLLGGMLTGGTVSQQGGTLAVQSGSFAAGLNSVTVNGALDLSGNGLQLKLVGANQFVGPGGSGPGSIVLTGNGTTLNVTDTETLSNLTLVFGSASSSAATLQLGSYFAQSLSFGSGSTVFVTGRALISNLAQTVSKQVLNSGSITVATTAVLEVGSGVQLASGGASGTLAIQTGGTLQLDGSYTTAGLRALVTSNAGTVAITGLLDNTGANLAFTPGVLPALTVQGGTLRGGVVQLGGGALRLVSGSSPYAPTSPTLDGVTLQGTLDLSSSAGNAPGANQVLFRNGLAVQSATGAAPGTILLTGAGQALMAADGETLDNARIALGNAAVAATLGAASGGSLTLGQNTTVAVSGLARIAGNGTYLTNFVNNGTVQVASGARLQITAGTILGVGTGTLSLAAGSTLELDGSIKTATLTGLVTTGGGLVELDGALNNAGQTLAVRPGSPLGAVLLRGGTIQGGTVQLAGGSFQVAGGPTGTAPVLDGVALQGTLDLSQPVPGTVGTYLGLRGGVAYAGAGGSGQGTVLLTAPGAELRALDQETLANVAVTLGGGAVLGTGSGGGWLVAAGAAVNVTGRASVGGSGSFANQGAIRVGTGARLDIGAGVSLGASGGTITVAAGGTFALDGNLTTSALLGLGLTGPGAVAVDGVLDNTGSTLQLKPGGALASLTLEGGTLRGGTLSLAGGSLLTGGAQPATLDGVAVQGALDLRLPHPGQPAALQIRGTSFQGADGTGPGSILLTGQNQSVVVGDSETLDNVAVLLGGGARLGEAAGGALTLGARAALDVAGEGWLTGGAIRNAGSILVESNQTLHVDSGFTNAGSLAVGYGGRVLVGGTTSLGAFAALARTMTGAGTLGLDAGALLDLGGGTLNLGAGSALDGATMLGTISDGTVVANGAALAAGNLVLDGATWQGVLAPAGGSLTLLDGAQVLAADGGAGRLDASRLGGGLTASGGLDRVAIALGGSKLQAGPAGLQLGGAASLSLGAGAVVAGTVADAGSVALSGGSAALTGTFTNSGSITVTSGTLTAANLVNAGTVSLSGGSTLQLGAAALGGTVVFGSGANRLAFGGAGYDAATLQGFRYGDSIDLGGLAYGATLSVSLQGNVLQVMRGATAVGSFTLQGGTYAAGQFSLASDGAGGTLLRTQYRPQPVDFTGPGTDFDRAWYLAQHPDVAASGADPLAHYLTTGWKLGYDPNPWFSTTYYLNQNPDVAKAGANPLVHYETSGWKEGRNPSALFSTRGYLAAYQDVAKAGMDPLQHFLNYGQFEGRSAVAVAPGSASGPDPLVDAAWYLAQHPDVAAAGLDPTQHYLTTGWKLGYNPDPWFDTKYYLTANPDVAKAGVNPLQHFETNGWKEGRQPSLAFNASAYLAAYPDVAKAGANPLVHYVQHGQMEGRMTFIAGPAATGPADPLVDRAYYFSQLATIVPASVDAAASYDQLGWKLGLNPDPWFDTKYYLSHNPDVAASGADPLTQFETAGWKQGRDPSAEFSVQKYLAAHPDVAASGVNPLAQFLSTGQAQGWQAFHV